MKLNILQIITSLVQVSKNAPMPKMVVGRGSFDLVAEMEASRRWLVEGGQQPMVGGWWVLLTTPGQHLLFSIFFSYFDSNPP